MRNKYTYDKKQHHVHKAYSRSSENAVYTLCPYLVTALKQNKKMPVNKKVTENSLFHIISFNLETLDSLCWRKTPNTFRGENSWLSSFTELYYWLLGIRFVRAMTLYSTYNV